MKFRQEKLDRARFETKLVPRCAKDFECLRINIKQINII